MSDFISSLSSNAHDLRCGDDGKTRPLWAVQTPLLQHYYDTEWGVPVRDEQGLFERISLEAFQAGLSWRTVLEKRPAFRALFHDFVPDRVAEMTSADVERLMLDARIIRNRRKIEATLHNARCTIEMRATGGLADFVWSFQPEVTPMPKSMAEIPTQSDVSKNLSKALKKNGFKFVGPTTMYALMEAIGMVDTHLLGSHRRGCSGLWDAEGLRIDRS